MKICHLVGSGDFDPLLFKKGKEDHVIACDGGLSRLMPYGILPDLLVGDFDSYTGPLPPELPTVVLPKEKDDTDMIYGARKGLEAGYRNFVVHGGLGGERLSHTVANLSLLSFLESAGGVGVLTGKNTLVAELPVGNYILNGQKDSFLSIFPLEGPAKVRERHLKYPLDDDLLWNMPLGVSNQFIGSSAEITVFSGKLLLVLENSGISPSELLHVIKG